jgi:antitoxin component YwqK of YwqJK toxin-antitoxin module
MLNGQRTGIWKYYSDLGNLEAEGVYENDELVGEWKYYMEGEFTHTERFDEE